jgi:hypothetical protein
MHRRAIYRFRRAARGDRSAEPIDRFPQTASTVCSRKGVTYIIAIDRGEDNGG